MVFSPVMVIVTCIFFHFLVVDVDAVCSEESVDLGGEFVGRGG